MDFYESSKLVKVKLAGHEHYFVIEFIVVKLVLHYMHSETFEPLQFLHKGGHGLHSFVIFENPGIHFKHFVVSLEEHDSQFFA